MEESAAGGARTDESSASLSSPSTIDPTPPPSPPSSPNQPLPSSLIELSPPSSPDPMDLFEQPDTFANVVQAASLDIARVNSSVVNAVAKIPKSFKQAKESPEWHEWKEAIEKELGMMKEKEVWEEAVERKPGMQLLTRCGSSTSRPTDGARAGSLSTEANRSA
jgi:hypothetical protein